MVPCLAWLFGARTKEHVSVFSKSLTAPLSFIRWGLKAIAEGSLVPTCKDIRQIHGSADRIIPAKLSGSSRLITGGGHLINLTHSKEVNEFLRSISSEL